MQRHHLSAVSLVLLQLLKLTVEIYHCLLLRYLSFKGGPARQALIDESFIGLLQLFRFGLVLFILNLENQQVERLFDLV